MLVRLLVSSSLAAKRTVIKLNYVSYCTESGRYNNWRNLNPENDIKHFIVENTEVVSKNALTPEIRLRLFTPNCEFWYAKPELWPFNDPYWAIYWPGGQALTRHLLNNPGLSRGKKVLDLGSGCGASAIAAKMCGAAYVLANDTDPVAAVATELNCELNGLEPIPCETKNLIGLEPKHWDLILLGDVFYEETMANSLHGWLQRCIQERHTKVLIGDPGRAHLESHRIRKHLHQQAVFELPRSVREENYGLTHGIVWSYQPEL